MTILGPERLEERYALAAVAPVMGGAAGAAADLDGDGVTDLIWRGESGVARGSIHTAMGSTARVFVLGGGGWTLAAIGDSDGDRVTDLVWRTPATGSVTVMLMDDTSVRGSAAVGGGADRIWRGTLAGLRRLMSQTVKDTEKHLGHGLLNGWARLINTSTAFGRRSVDQQLPGPGAGDGPAIIGRCAPPEWCDQPRRPLTP